MRRSHRLAALVLLVAGTWMSSARGQTPAASTDVNAATALRMRVPAVQFDQVAFVDVLDFLRDVARLNVYVNWPALEAAGVDRSAAITLRLRQIPLRTVLDLTLRQANGGGTDLAWYVSDNIVYITTSELAGRQLVTRVFDVRDLLVPVPDFTNAPRIQLGGGGGGGGGSTNAISNGGGGAMPTDESRAIRGERLVELIKMLVQPDVWIENGGFSSIRFFNGSLIVTAPRDVLAQIGR